jgi:pilus assembly protein Flp/PilA
VIVPPQRQRSFIRILNEEAPMRQLITNAVVNFMKREDGPTAVEYAVMLALIIVVCITAITTLGQNANTTFQNVGTAVGGAGS